MHRSKACFKCGQEKPIDEFYKHPSMGDGHSNKCKECTKKSSRETRLRRIDYYRAYDRERAKIPDRAKAASAISALWRQADKRRMKCHDAVTRAVRSGKLVRLSCERCGCTKTFAHHESYDKPLDVIWLCQPCHKKRHKEMAIQGIDP